MNKSRSSNIELLRIICMCFVIAGHVIMKYKNDNLGTVEYYISNILRSFFMVAVNCFVIISGYFGIKINIKKLIKISIQVSFYSIVIYLITIFSGIHTINIKKDILILFPIITKRYWYITIYFVLCLISPLLNIIVKNLNEIQFKYILSGAFILFYFLPTINYAINAPTITNDSGYGIINFICLYFLGRYIRIYYRENKSKTFYASGFIISSLLVFLTNHILTLLLGFYFNSFISYDTIFCFISAFMLFMTFKKLNFTSNIINNLSKYALAAFIIHMHPTFFDYLFYNIFRIEKYFGIRYLMIILIIPIVVYSISWIIEYVRIRLFNEIENKIIENIFNNKNILRVKELYNLDEERKEIELV
ncbi:acyltransferase [Clostridioides difficile]